MKTVNAASRAIRKRERHSRRAFQNRSFESLEQRLNLSGAAVVDGPTCLLDPVSDHNDGARAARAVNCFAADLYDHYQDSTGNLFLSPMSIATAFAMTSAGAGGRTAAEMESVIHIGQEPGAHQAFGDYLNDLNGQGQESGLDLAVANAIWPSDQFQVSGDFSDTVEHFYGGSAQSLDYTNPAAAEKIINDWAAENTREKIKKLVDGSVDSSTVMVLTNAIYFKSSWKYQFDPARTHAGKFQTEDGSHVDADLMYLQTDFRYTVIDGFKVLELPYEGDTSSMVLMMTVDRSQTGEVTPELMAKANDWLDSAEAHKDEVTLILPKFEIAVSSNLTNTMQGMGMRNAFSTADFRPMFDGGNMTLGFVNHEAVIEVNEEGTEAAAATAIGGFACFAAGTPVLTPDGAKSIEELKVGDYVLSRNEHDVTAPVQKKKIKETFNGKSEIMAVQVGGQVIRPTTEHPFFVRDKGWTRACDLHVGDQLATDLSSWMEVEKLEATGEFETVYNFRVADLHTYFLGSEEWGFSVWAHNAYGPDFIANRPFHFMIRDNVHSSILFMGRMNDPTQAKNSLSPIVNEPVEITFETPIAGDSNRDGRFDSGDLIAAFQAAKYEDDIPQNATFEEGDWNGDGDFNSRDLIYAFQNSVYESGPVAALANHDSTNRTFENAPTVDKAKIAASLDELFESLDNQDEHQAIYVA